MRYTVLLGFLAALASCSASPKADQELIPEVVVEQCGEACVGEPASEQEIVPEEITLVGCLASDPPPVNCLEVLRAGCEMRNPDACFWVAKEALKESPEAYRASMEKACKAGSMLACSARHNIAIDAELPEYQAGCDSGDPWACLKAGTVLDRSKERLMACTSSNSTAIHAIGNLDRNSKVFGGLGLKGAGLGLKGNKRTCAAGDARGCWASAATLFLASEYQDTLPEYSVGWNKMYSHLRKAGVNDSSFAELVTSCRDGDAVSCLDAADFIATTESTQDLACVAGLTSQLCRPDLDWGCHSPLYLIKSGKSGVLRKDEIRSAIRMIRPAIKDCYVVELQKNSELKGRVMVRFHIAYNGKVSSAVVSETTLHDETTENCILGVVRQHSFPKPRGGRVIVNYPFNFLSEIPTEVDEEQP